jgi:hypothetical protein
MVVIKEISKIVNEWMSYDEFKIFDSNRNDKEQNKFETDYDVWSHKGWTKIKRVIRHKCKKKIYRVLTHTGVIDVTEDHSLLDDKNKIIKPGDCKIGTKLLHSFPFKDTNKYKNKVYSFTDKCKAQKKYYTLKSKGYNVVISAASPHSSQYYYKEKNSFYHHSNIILNLDGSDINLICSKISNNNDNHKIIKIIDLGYTNDYVYDLETEHGCYNAGIGEIVVKNTDSIFVDFRIKNEITDEYITDKKALKVAIDLCVLMGELINYLLPKPQKLNYEKTFHPWISLAKKMYTGYLYEFDINKYYLKNMGIVLKRRDNAPIVKIVVGGIVHSILKYRSAKKAVEFTKDSLKKILSGKYTDDKFVITKTIKGPGLTKSERIIEANKRKEDRIYADRSTLVHAVVADRMADRDPGSKPLSNDRIPYVYVETNRKVKLQGDRAEHIDYVRANDIKIDYLFYITNQIMKPAIQFLEKLVRNPEKIFDIFITREINKRMGKRPIKVFFKDHNDEDNTGISCHNDVPDSNISSIKIKRTKKIRKRKATISKKYNGSFLLDCDDDVDDNNDILILKKRKKKIRRSKKTKKRKIIPSTGGGFMLE